MKNNQGLTPNLPLWSFQIQSDSKLALKSRKDLEIHLITRALKDEDFKQELIANPKAVIEEELGTQLPEDLEIKVLEETEDTIYMVLPCNPYEGVSEEELQASLGMTYEDVAQWVLDQQRNTLLDEESSIKLIVKSWSDEVFTHNLLKNTKLVIEEKLEEKTEKNTKIQVLRENLKVLYISLPNIQDNFAEFLRSTESTLETNMPMIIGSGGIACRLSGGTGSQRAACPTPAITSTDID